MDELDVTTAESKATYEEIQEWVQEKYGFHVTNLNIAQVKRKYGIIERENYNKPKSPDSRQPGCTEEKVKAIEAALKHFQMIATRYLKNNAAYKSSQLITCSLFRHNNSRRLWKMQYFQGFAAVFVLFVHRLIFYKTDLFSAKSSTELLTKGVYYSTV